MPTPFRPVVQTPPAPTKATCDTDTQRYAIDVGYLNALQEQLMRKGLLDPGSVTVWSSSFPCITPCDRQWLTNAVVAAERLVQSGARPSSFPAIPNNLCNPRIIGN